MSVSASIILTSCASFSSATPFPEMPEDLVKCAEKAALDIPTGPLSQDEAKVFTAQLRASELSGHRCAANIAKWYEDLRLGQR